MKKKLSRFTNNKKIIFSDNKTYVIFTDTFSSTKKESEKIKNFCTSYNQVKIIIKQEGNMYDEEILSISPKIKIYAGVAWTLIYKRRLENNLLKEYIQLT